MDTSWEHQSSYLAPLSINPDKCKIYLIKLPNFTRPGIGVSGAEWVVDNKIGLLLYDFEDAMHPSEPFAQAQLLEWAIGQGIVSGCELSRAVEYYRKTGRAEGLLVVSPLKIPKGTGSLVNPLWIV